MVYRPSGQAEGPAAIWILTDPPSANQREQPISSPIMELISAMTQGVMLITFRASYGSRTASKTHSHVAAQVKLPIVGALAGVASRHRFLA